MRTLVVALVALSAAAPLAAQAGGMDPTTAVKGSGKLPDGWTARFDPVRARPNQPAPPAPDLTLISFVTMGSGFHVTSGPNAAALYYNAKDVAKGDFTVSASFAQRKSSGHEAYGIFIGGSNLPGATQNYLYFVIHPNGGKYLINHRSSDAAPRAVVAYTVDPSINKDDPADGHATNELAITVKGDIVHFIVNGKEVKALKKSELGEGVSTDGQVGLRINHNLDLHISGFGVKK